MRHLNIITLLVLTSLTVSCKKKEDEVVCTCIDLTKGIEGRYLVNVVSYKLNGRAVSYNPADSLETASLELTKVDALRVRLVFSLTTKAGKLKLASDSQSEISRDITPLSQGELILNSVGYTTTNQSKLFLTLYPSTSELSGLIGISASR